MSVSNSRSGTRLRGKATCNSNLVEPIRGPSIFADHLAAHGEGLQHVGKYVTDHEAAVDEALAAGFVPLQSAARIRR